VASESDFLSKFIQFVDASERTADTYTKNIKQFYKFLLKNNISKPTRSDILAYKDELKATHKSTTVQSYIGALRLYFRFLASEGLYPNIADNIKGAKVSRENKKDYLTATQCKDLLHSIDQSSAKGLRNYAITALMLTGGLRTIEVVRADLEDLRTLGGGTVLYIQGKGKQDKADFIKIPEATETALRNWTKVMPVKDKALFQSLSNQNKGDRMTTRAISALIKDELKAIGLDSDRLTAHSLRHTAVTLSLLGGGTIQEAQQFARHANISTTQIYAHNLSKTSNPCGNMVANSIF